MSSRSRPHLSSLLTALATACAWLALPSPALACKKRHQTPFELYDTAAVVAVVEVTSVPAPATIRNRPGPGEVALAALHVLKPAPTDPAAPARLTTRLSGTSCDLELAVGDRALIFLGADGLPEGAHDGYLRDPELWRPVLEELGAARDTAARAEVLVRAATGPHAAARREAASYLVEEPALLAALDADQRARLARELTVRPRAERADDLPLVLVRLRQPAAAAALPRWQKLARALAAVRDFEEERDPARLARAIERARRPALRWAAFERCERARGQRLGRFARYIEDLDRLRAADLAASCRDGTPLGP